MEKQIVKNSSHKFRSNQLSPRSYFWPNDFNYGNINI